MTELFIALSAGLISFLSPCVLPIIPGYIAYISGSTLEDLSDKKNTNLLPIFLFTVGFSIVFIIFGASATFLGKFLLSNSFPLRIIAGIIIIPAIILNGKELLNKILPKNVAEAPNIINTIEKPTVNKNIGNKFIFFFSNKSSNVLPEM